MVDYGLLLALVTFAQQGTVRKTAQALGLTSPAVTHALKKLEEETNVQLFIRRPNKISLTKAGQYAAHQAQRLVKENHDFIPLIQRYDERTATVTLAANAPGPLIVARAIHDSRLTIVDHYLERNFVQILMDDQVTILITNQRVESPAISSAYLGTEEMMVNLSSKDQLAKRQSLTYANLRERSILSPAEVGFWRHLYQEHIPGVRLISQSRPEEYNALLNYSELPFFTTNLTHLDPHWGRGLPDNRVILPLEDDCAHQRFYASFLKLNRRRVAPVIARIRACWSQRANSFDYQS